MVDAWTGSAAIAACAAAALLCTRPAPGRAVWRNRGVTAALVAAFLLATRGWTPDPDRRAGWQYLFTITLGYGHLIGALVFARARAGPGRAARRLGDAFVATSALSLFAAYTWALNRVDVLFIPLLAVSVWHTVENDLGLARAYAAGLRLGAIPRALEHHLISLGTSALLILAAAGTPLWLPYTSRLLSHAAGRFGTDALLAIGIGFGLLLLLRGRRGAGAALLLAAGLISLQPGARLTFADLFVAVTLYHLVSWLVFFADRARALAQAGEPAAARALWRRLAWVHLLPAAVCVALLLPMAADLAALRFALFSPAIYLFWSVLHVAQTAWRRGFERRPAAA